MLLSSTILAIVFNITKLFSSRDGGLTLIHLSTVIYKWRRRCCTGIRENEKETGAMSSADFRKFPFVRKPSATEKANAAQHDWVRNYFLKIAAYQPVEMRSIHIQYGAQNLVETKRVTFMGVGYLLLVDFELIHARASRLMRIHARASRPMRERRISFWTGASILASTQPIKFKIRVVRVSVNNIR